MVDEENEKCNPKDEELVDGNKSKEIKGRRNNIEPQQNELQSKLLKRNIKVAGAPKMPLSGYVRFLHERREQLRREQPQKSAMEYMKIISEEWQAMSDDIKEPYLRVAAIEKQKYLTEMSKFLEEHPEILAKELAKDSAPRNNGRKSKMKREKSLSSDVQPKKEKPDKKLSKSLPPQDKPKIEIPQPSLNARLNEKKLTTRNVSPLLNSTNINLTVPTVVASYANKSATGEIPIFTSEFLEHNKIFDNELRSLRKQKIDFEQQNAVLERHVENTKVGLEKVEKENSERDEQNGLLEEYLAQLEQKLVAAFAGLGISNISSGATSENIHQYMAELYRMATANTHAPGLNKARDIIRKLDLQVLSTK